jgi:hypothetical protein
VDVDHQQWCPLLAAAKDDRHGEEGAWPT